MVDHNLKCGVYKHYKGQYYLLLGVARHSETGDHYCVYVPLYTIEGGQGMAIRPLYMWNEFVEILDNGVKIKVRRFHYMGTI